LSVIRTVPVLWNPLGFTPSSTDLMTASTAISPIRVGNCMTVAPIVPSGTLRTPEQLPSIEVTRTSRLAFLIAKKAPCAAGSLIV
jgi:hypothetical protein